MKQRSGGSQFEARQIGNENLSPKKPHHKKKKKINK
jgi:hypothetical protein